MHKQPTDSDLLRQLARPGLPRLRAALQRRGLLSTGETDSVIRALRRGDDYACEAVAHYGGARKLLADAIRWRHGHA